ncbi:NAD(P)-dependent oxidoreductase, partial [Faecalibacterium sp. DFI.5.82]|nr:NAD(P)-dependent oxidoreductase [Faecalibacterium sp. DFI.5.82]
AMHNKGETLGNVAFGIDYLANSKAIRLGDDIAVIGVGNSAKDCARTAIRNGARHVTCYARRDESCISASEYEVSYAMLEGVGFRLCKAPVEIRENGLF